MCEMLRDWRLVHEESSAHNTRAIFFSAERAPSWPPLT
jgi:hypothetical protein